MNPHEALSAAGKTLQPTVTCPPNRIGWVGFILSAVGFLGPTVFHYFHVEVFEGATCAAVLFFGFWSFPGLILSFVGLLKKPRCVACLGFVLGLFGSFFVIYVWPMLYML